MSDTYKLSSHISKVEDGLVNTLKIYRLYWAEACRGRENDGMIPIPDPDNLPPDMVILQQKLLGYLFEDIPTLQSFTVYAPWGVSCIKSVNGVDYPHFDRYGDEMKSFLVESNLKKHERELMSSVMNLVPKNRTFNRKDFISED